MNKVNYVEQLEKDYQHWQDVYENGCNDPSWSDGMNLNLIRNHIIYDKRQLKETLDERELPEVYYKELPPKVDYDYMAKPVEILETAIRYYSECTSLEEWNTLDNAFDFLDRKDSKQQSVRFLVSRIRNLKIAIDSMDYVTMRRFKDPTEDVEKIRTYTKELKNMEFNHLEQMNLFQM